jgi:hypothetical protein
VTPVAGSCGPVDATHISCSLAGPVGPGASVLFLASLTAGQDPGAFTHVLGAGSDGSEPEPDTHLSHVVFEMGVAGEVEPLDLGNSTNYLGTGMLLGSSGTGRPSEEVFLAVNPYCTDKVNGDRYQSGYVGSSCGGGPNPEYRSEGYTYAIDVPEDRTAPIDVLLYDARYNDQFVPTGQTLEEAIDTFRQSGEEPFTFSLYAADSTPLDPTDDPLMCTRTFEFDTPFDAGPYLGSVRWNRLCQIQPDAPAGRYLLRVRNSGMATSPKGDGSNQFGIVAAPAGATEAGDLLCDSGDPGCPVVSGPGEMSIRAWATAAVSRIGLGSVGVEHEGRELRLDLYDPGEGGQFIRILRPTGPGTWAPATVTWSSPGVAGTPSTGTSIPVRAGGTDIFNGRLLSISVDLTGYSPPAGNDRWLLEYQFAGGAVTDRTTWNVSIADRLAP